MMNMNPSLEKVIDDVDLTTVTGFCNSSNKMQFVASFCHVNYNSDDANLKHTVFAVMKDTVKNYVLPVVTSENVRKIPDYFSKDFSRVAAAAAVKSTNFSTFGRGL